MAEQEAQWEPTDEEQGGVIDEENLIEIIDEEEEESPAAPEPEEREIDSDRVQKRIDQLTFQRREAERREAEAETRLTAMQEKMNNIESGIDDQRVNSFQQKYDAVKTDLFEAAETGNTQRQVELTEQMADMRATARIAQMRRKEQQETPVKAVNPTVEATAKSAAPQEAYAWWAKNKWFESQEHTPETMFAKSIDNQLESEGLDKNTPEYYEELDNRLQKRFPELYSKVKKSKPPTAPSGGRGTGKTSKDGRIRMTAQELQVARDLDITSEEGLREYAKELQFSRSN
tara:strand:- start:235 stop:1098 length:864 start_codon:yes stop_codon:yes gene_type:complete